ncbi:MAG: TetR/AcrR family transcriptional regulator [Verrucomicrobiae bacterium]|nr:TetR/AcrR family transcriptional regulator [Verrucomicrobiae bacterium]
MVLTGAAGSARGRVVEYARGVFLREGFRRITMDEIAAGMGISKRTLYEAVPSKEALVGEVLDAQIARVSGLAQRVVGDRSLPYRRKVEEFLLVLARAISAVSPAFLGDLKRLTPGLYARFQRMREENVLRIFKGMIVEGKESGHLRDGVEPVLAAEAFFHALRGLTDPEVMGRLQIVPEIAFRHTLDLFLHGMLRGSPGRASRQKARSKRGEAR